MSPQARVFSAIVVVIAAELFFGAIALVGGSKPMFVAIVVWLTMLASIPFAVLAGLALGGHNSGGGSGGVVEVNLYANNLAMRRNMDRMVQLADEQIIRERMK